MPTGSPPPSRPNSPHPPARPTRPRGGSGCGGAGGEASTPLPAPPEALAAFLAERAEAGLHFSTLDCYCSGIAHRHHQEGFADPIADFLVRRVRRGLRRILGVAPIRQAHPLTVVELGQIVSSIGTDTAIGKRDRAILLVGYASAMRPGEISALNVEDLLRKPTGVLINIRRSKADQDAQGQLVGVARGENRLTDPIRALDEWLKIRPPAPGALFTRVLYRNHPTSESVGPRAISRTVQERANAAGFGGVPVSGHSLRAGHAVTAISARCSTTTYDPPRRWLPPPAETSASERVHGSEATSTVYTPYV